MLKNILSVIGALSIVGILGAYVSYDIGGKMDMMEKYDLAGIDMDAIEKLDPQALPEYIGMFKRVLETGNAPAAMVKKVQIEEAVSTEELVENFTEIALGANFKVVGDATMSTSGVDQRGNKTKLIRFVSFCSPSIAKVFIDFSESFSAFMPCRIAIIEHDDGTRWMYTMSMELMLFGGKTLPPEMLEKAEHVRDTIYLMMDEAGKEDGDF